MKGIIRLRLSIQIALIEKKTSRNFEVWIFLNFEGVRFLPKVREPMSKNAFKKGNCRHFTGFLINKKTDRIY